MTKTQSISTPFRGLSVFQNIPPAEDLPKLYEQGKVLHVPMNAGWTATVSGSGAITQVPAYIRVTSGITASSIANASFNMWGFGRDGSNSWTWMDWSKKIYLMARVSLSASDAESARFLQIKEAATMGHLGQRGIGIYYNNLALNGQAYNTAIVNVDLGTTVTDGSIYHIVIKHQPTIPKIEWYVNGILKGNTVNTAFIPMLLGDTSTRFVISSYNGVTGGQNAFIDVAQSHIWSGR